MRLGEPDRDRLNRLFWIAPLWRANLTLTDRGGFSGLITLALPRLRSLNVVAAKTEIAVRRRHSRVLLDAYPVIVVRTIILAVDLDDDPNIVRKSISKSILNRNRAFGPRSLTVLGSQFS
jgi:hypothetical protein